MQHQRIRRFNLYRVGVGISEYLTTCEASSIAALQSAVADLLTQQLPERQYPSEARCVRAARYRAEIQLETCSIVIIDAAQEAMELNAMKSFGRVCDDTSATP